MRRRVERLSPPGGRARRGRGLLQILVREPREGQVKTRLAAGVGATRALHWHLWSLHRTLALSASLRGIEVELWVDGEPRNPRLVAMASAAGARLRRQVGGDLGRRLDHAVRHGLARHPRVLVIGGDCVSLQPEHLRQADAWLAAGGVAALTPAEDGGYLMIGLSRHHPRLFRRIEWGSGRVLAQTRAALRELGWGWLESDTLWDLDRPTDLDRPALAAVDPRALDAESLSSSIRRTRRPRIRPGARRSGHRVRRTQVPRNS